jgi:hypothetical protein|tara:strand:+ start:20661 stop:20873 length:213 start_codon:yes stop_codon:yes gene_type:complete
MPVAAAIATVSRRATFVNVDICFKSYNISRNWHFWLYCRIYYEMILETEQVKIVFAEPVLFLHNLPHLPR